MTRAKLLVAAALAFSFLSTQLLLARERQAESRAGSVEESLSAFITAFNNLDWPRFQACFSATATIFHPSAPNVRRISAPGEFEKAWLGVFERIKRSSARSAPPYMDLRPLDLRLEKLSEDVTLVTFHLVDGNVLSRRTLVFKHETDGWKIVHIHASNLAMP